MTCANSRASPVLQPARHAHREGGEGPFGFSAEPCDYLQSDHKYSIDACMGARPAANYWPGQLAETVFVLALAVLAAAAAVWVLRRRTG